MIQKTAKKHAWRPDRPTSKGATAYHDAVVNAFWHIENINGLIELVKGQIKEGDIVVDFGAGTGASAVYLLRHIPENFTLWLVDNSPSWLGKAYDVLGNETKVKYFLLEKIENRYATLAETIGKNVADYVLSANTFHLIPTLQETFKGIYEALKPRGTFVLQSGNITREDRDEGLLMIDNTVKRVHDIAIKLLLKNSKFSKYRKGLSEKIEQEESQRKLVFPDPRPTKHYLEILKSVGFENEEVSHRKIKVLYKDWLEFLRVRRLQAGILPEIGGKDASLQQEQDRDELITKASLELFKELETKNPFADKESFSAEWTYIKVKKNL